MQLDIALITFYKQKLMLNVMIAAGITSMCAAASISDDTMYLLQSF